MLDGTAHKEIGARRLTNSCLLLEYWRRNTKIWTNDDWNFRRRIDAINRLSALKKPVLIPVGKDEKGNPEVIDFSYTNPWDMFSNPSTHF